MKGCLWLSSIGKEVMSAMESGKKLKLKIALCSGLKKNYCSIKISANRSCILLILTIFATSIVLGKNDKKRCEQFFSYEYSYYSFNCGHVQELAKMFLTVALCLYNKIISQLLK